MDVSANNCACPNDDSLKDETMKRSKVVLLASDFAERTTFHGVRYVVNGGYMLRRLVWLVFFLVSAGYLAVSTLILLKFFLSYPVSTKNKIVNPNRLLFPAVTICNFNILRASKYRELEDELLAKNITLGTSSANKLNASEMLRKYGHQFHEDGMLIDCTWKGEQCSSNDFFTSVQDMMGLCQTFNSGSENQRLRYVTTPGESSGLKLTLNVETYEYREDTAAIGLKVRVHDQTEPTLISDLGFAVMPGSKALVSVLKRQIETLPFPYESNCKKTEDGETYSQAGCLALCKKDYLLSKCQCQTSPPFREDIPVCSWNQYDECHKVYGGRFYEEVKRNCSCVEACSRTVYQADLSYALFNEIKFSQSLYKSFQEIMGLNFTEESPEWRDFLRENVLQLSVFYNDLTYERSEEVPAYPFESFIAEAGGLMGLFLGASVLTGFEVVDLICHVIAVHLWKRRA